MGECERAADASNGSGTQRTVDKLMSWRQRQRHSTRATRRLSIYGDSGELWVACTVVDVVMQGGMFLFGGAEAPMPWRKDRRVPSAAPTTCTPPRSLSAGCAGYSWLKTAVGVRAWLLDVGAPVR